MFSGNNKTTHHANQNTSLENTTPAGDSNTTNEMIVRKINTYQHTFWIVASSLLALLVLLTVKGTRGGHHLQLPLQDIAESAVVFVDLKKILPI